MTQPPLGQSDSHQLSATEAAILLAAIESEVHYLGWLDNTGWTEDQFFAAVDKLRAIAGLPRGGE